MLKEPTNVTCVLEKEDVEKIENIAKDTGANKSVLIRMWITEKLRQIHPVDLNKYRGGE